MLQMWKIWTYTSYCRSGATNARQHKNNSNALLASIKELISEGVHAALNTSSANNNEVNVMYCDIETYSLVASSVIGKINDGTATFYWDSGAGKAICWIREYFDEIEDNASLKITIGNGASYYAKGKGRIGEINNVYYVPDLRFNLLPVGVFADHGYELTFGADFVSVIFNGSEVRVGT